MKPHSCTSEHTLISSHQRYKLCLQGNGFLDNFLEKKMYVCFGGQNLNGFQRIG
jgi:hypothetical protein